LTISFFPFIPVKKIFTAKGIDRRKFTKHMKHSKVIDMPSHGTGL